MDTVRPRGLPKRARGIAAFLGVNAVVIGLAATYHGVPMAQVHLNDGGVWVTNGSMRLAAHLNYPSRTLDGGVVAPSGDFDVSQQANDIALHDLGQSTVSSIDTATVEIGTPVPLAGLAAVQGGDVVAVADARKGRVWAVPVAELGLFSPDTDPLLDELDGVQVAVSDTGTVAAVETDGTVHLVTGVTHGTLTVTDGGRVADLPPDAGFTLTMVGSTVVALDDEGHVHTTTGASADAVPAGSALQLPGPGADDVVLAAPDGLVSMGLDGGGLDRLGPTLGSGAPAAPAVVGGCVYGVWSGTGSYVRDCPGDADDVNEAYDALADTELPQFRVNRDVVVLNDTANGNVFLVNDGMRLVDNWDDIAQSLTEDEKTKKTKDKKKTRAAPKRTDKNTDPKAHPDSFGVRPGRATALPVLANDTDADGDFLTASAKGSSLGTVSRVRGGAALQLTPDRGVEAGTDTFSYTASDGRGGEATSTVRVEVHDWNVNGAPQRLEGRRSVVELGTRAETRYNLLSDWVDPDGDPVFLKSVGGTKSIAVEFTPDGEVDLRHLGTGDPGRQSLPVVISDGRAETTGDLLVDVLGKDNVPPVANGDHVQVVAGEQAVVRPIANDSDPNGDELRLTQVDPGKGGLRTRMDTETSTFTVDAKTPGTSYVGYQVSDGPTVSAAVVRVDVIERGRSQAPVADNDIATLPAGGSTLVDVLANDDDPTGGVLVVTGVTTDTSGTAPDLSVQVVNNQLLRVSAPSGLETPAEVGYTISNGYDTASARVTVVPLPAVPTTKPPVPVNDQGTVRAGDVITMPVTDNDTSPSGAPLTVEPELQVPAGQPPGEAWVSENTVRFRAGSQPGRVRLTYTVRDTHQNYASAEVVLTIRALDGDRNSPPSPEPLVGRVIAGRSVALHVPLDGIDPDGDSVSLLGLDQAPEYGTAVVEDGSLRYTAPEDASGTDRFSYRVEDRFGAVATGSVSVGIAPSDGLNQPPVPILDEVSARPERALTIAVAANDLDPDGDAVAVVPDSVEPVDETTTTPAEVADGRVALTTPPTEALLQYTYDVTDHRGGRATGNLTVAVSPDAPLLAPIARDDYVSVASVVGQDSVRVPVLDNDDDPDGSVAELVVSTEEAGVRVAGDGSLVIPVADERRLVLYDVTDQDGLVGRAVVVVPGAAEQPPVLDEDKVPVEVEAGEELVLPLADYVTVRSGRSPLLASVEEELQAGPGADGSPLARDNKTLVFRSRPDFAGLTSLTFEVTDGSSLDDPDGLTAVLTLPIQVTSARNTPPTFQPSTVSVAAGDQPTTVDLGAMVTDPDPGDQGRVTFKVVGASKAFDVSVRGQQLRVSAPADVTPGTLGTVDLSLTDGRSDAVSGSLPLRVVASTRPLMTTTPIVIDDATAGEPRKVDVKPYVTNPFAAEGKPIEVVGVQAANGSVSQSGTTLTITPQAGFHGQMTAQYTVADATHDRRRQVQGLVRLTVRDRPDAPTAVVAETHLSHTATVSWRAPANNGAEITNYAVSWTGQDRGSRDCGRVTTCTVDGLPNNKTITFTVVAANEVGDSDPSARSNEVRPDVKPDQPAPPTTEFGDRQITVHWTKPHTDGSPVTSYTLEVSPPVGGVTQRRPPAPR
ncbi:Ig-like domain-containing protein [Nocardioides sp.]|uniref:Ig-like domain-containing protein n=1 Tax=Nocardioides sp. TaxID=35761 RepID=UPI003529CD81